jgi:hypothetical protein
MHATAARELLRKGGTARLEVVFHADVSLEEALEEVRMAGAWPVDPLPLGFAPPRNVEIWASSSAARALAAQDAVAILHAPEGEIQPMNSKAAELSNVPPLFEPPYGLTGEGVSVGVIDVGNAQASHPEFESRVTAHSGTTTAEHPTHVVGTIVAKGIQPGAKGMAPAATVHQYAHSGSFLTDIESNIPTLNLVAVNNSWGFITGWNYDDSKQRWGWYGNEAFGAYSSTSAAVDQLTRSKNALFVFSAGNDGNDNGPSTPPWEHVHPADSDAEAIWCFSADGSGTDCPATPCGTRCEKERHPADGTFNNMSRTGSSKNVIAVGAITTTKAPASFSSRGPTRDGRVKPDVVAKGFDQYSTVPPAAYKRLQGTSMSTPVVTGIAALLTEQWRKTAGGEPGAAVLKALLIHGAQDLGLPGPDYTYGFGLVDAKASVDTILADGGRGDRIVRGSVGSGEAVDFLLDATAGTPARLTLVWMDPETTPYPVNEMTLVNDLDLRIVGPGPSSFSPWVPVPSALEFGASLGANRRDSVEQVDFTPPVVGAWRATVRAAAVPGAAKQEFVLVSSVPVVSSRPSCQDPYEPNDYADEAWGNLRSGKNITARLCSGTDVDYYRFTPDLAGPVSVTVSSAAPVRITLIAPNGAQSTALVPGGGSATLPSSFPGGPSGKFLLKVEPEGTLAGEAVYTIQTSYGSTQSPRGRTARR